jgi:hypothetical protein
MRKLGSPNTTPTAAAHSPPMAKAPMIGTPGMRSTALYAMKAPTAMNAAVPSESCPA